MKPANIAQECGVSTATLYRRLAKMGLKLGDFKDEAGNISAEKMQELKEILSGDREKTENIKKEFALSQELSCERELRIAAERQAAEAAARAAAAEAEATAARAAADARTTAAEAEAQRMRERLEDMRRELEEAHANSDRWYQAAMQAQQLQLQQMRLLPERVTLSQRVRGWFTRTKKETEEK